MHQCPNVEDLMMYRIEFAFRYSPLVLPHKADTVKYRGSRRVQTDWRGKKKKQNRWQQSQSSA